jgi:type IV pilus assembly protein PilO
MEMSLSKLPWYAQVGAFVALAVGACVAFYVYYEKPVKADMVGRQDQLKAIKADITKGLSTAKKLDEFRAEVDDLEEHLNNLKAVLPEEKDAADLLRSMQNVAMQSNLTIKGFKPSAPVTQELHAEWPIALELDGTYHNLAIFFDRVGKFTRIVNISGVQIQGKPKPAPNSTITAKCIATTFVLIDPNAPPPKAKKGAKPAKPAAAPAAKKAA